MKPSRKDIQDTQNKIEFLLFKYNHARSKTECQRIYNNLLELIKSLKPEWTKFKDE